MKKSIVSIVILVLIMPALTGCGALQKIDDTLKSIPALNADRFHSNTNAGVYSGHFTAEDLKIENNVFSIGKIEGSAGYGIFSTYWILEGFSRQLSAE